MDYINSILGPQKGLLVEEAIPTLCNRLQHATLSTDRRSAVLGLKSFSRQYRELVVQYGLKPLVATLVKDSAQDAIVKAVLETLLVLFIRGENNGETDDDTARGWISQQLRVQNGKYPSPILLQDGGMDQFLLMVADELTQAAPNRQSPEDSPLAVMILVVSKVADFHIRLYALQLLELLVAARPARTREALLAIPTAFFTLVSLLNDPHEPVRNEAILFLMAAVNTNFNIQKLVAFENTFDILFDIIDEEGGIRGSILVQDCLTLLTNLLMYNSSNQKYFLETTCVARLAKLLGEPLADSDPDFASEPGLAPPPMVWTDQRLQNMVIALEICRTLVEDDRDGHNQKTLFDAGLLFVLLKLAFSPETVNHIRSVALLCTADLISGNPDLQLEFSKVDVPYTDPSLPTVAEYSHPLAIPSALITWALNMNSVSVFDVRVAAICCLHEYVRDNNEAKMAFLKEQIEAYSEQPAENGHLSNGTSTPAPPLANLFSTLMDYDAETRLNPYKIWFASVIMLYLFEDCSENRQLARAVKIGNDGAGEEVMTAIQAMSSLLVTTLDNADIRISIGYMMLLSVWFVGDFEAVDDFLADISTIRSLIAFVTNNSSELSIKNGMVMLLLGIAYEFSTKDSPTLRVDLHQLLLKAVGTSNYSLKVKQYVDDDSIKNFDDQAIFNYKKDDTGLPQVYFDGIYVLMLKENQLRFRRALSHSPHVQPRAKINYETYEELTRDHEELQRVVTSTKQSAEDLKGELNLKIKEMTEQFETADKSLKTTSNELESLREQHSKTQEQLKLLETEIAKTKKDRDAYLESTKKYEKELQDKTKASETSNELIKTLNQKLLVSEEGRKKAEDGINKMNRELLSLTKLAKEAEKKTKLLENELQSGRRELEKKTKEFEANLASLNKEKLGLKEQLELLKKQMADLEASHSQNMKDRADQLADKEASNEHLMDKLRAAGNAILKMKSELEETTRAHKSLEEQISGSKKSIETFMAAEKKYQEHISALEKTTEDQRAEFEALKDEKTKLNERIESMEADHQSHKDKSDELTTELKKQKDEVEQSIIRLKAEHEKNKSAIISEKEMLSKELDETKSKLTALESTTRATEEELVAIKKKFEDSVALSTEKSTTLQSAVDALKEELQTSQSTLKDSDKKMKEAKSKMVLFETKIEQLEAEIAVLKEKLTKAEEISARTSEELQSKSAELKAAKDASDARIKELEEEIADLKATKEKLQAEVKLLDEKKIAFEKEVASGDERHKQHTKKIEELEETVSKAKGQLKINLESLRSKDEEVASHKKEALGHRNTLADNTKVIQEHEKSISDNLTTITALEKSIADIKEQKDKLEALLDEKSKQLEESKDELAQTKIDMDAKLEAAENRASDLETSLSDRAMEMEKDRALLSENSETAVKEYSSKVSKLESTIADMRKEHQTKTKEMESAKSKHESNLKSLRKRLETAESELKAATEKYTSMESSKESLQGQFDAAKKEAAEKEKELVKLRKELTDTTKQLSEAHLQHETLKATEAETHKELVGNLELHEKTKNELQESGEKLSKVREELELLQEENDALDEKLAELERERELADQQISQLKEELAKSSEASKSAHGEKHALESTVSSLQDRLSTYESSVSALESRLADATSGKKEHDEKGVALEREVKELTAKFEQVSKENKELQLQAEKDKSDSEEKETKYQSDVKELEAETKKLATEIASLKAEIKQHKESEKSAAEEEKKIQAKLQELTEANAKLKQLEGADAKVEQLEKDNAKLQLEKEVADDERRAAEEKLKQKEKEANVSVKPDSSKYVPKSELDDMMLLMSDMDESIKKYKKLLRKHGEEVSSDESLSGEEDDEE